MPKLKVLIPFSLRLATGKPVREFPVGEHTVSKEELQHWFTQGCIAEGRAVELAESQESSGTPPAKPAKTQEYTETALKKLNNAQLKEIAAELGISFDEPEPVKATMVSAILKVKTESESAGDASKSPASEGGA